MKIYIGLTGENRSGKDTFCEIVSEICKKAGISVDKCTSSDVLFKTFDVWKIKKTRKNAQKLVSAMVSKFGSNILSKAMKQLMKCNTADIVIFNGVRMPSDITMLKTLPNSFIVYVTAEVKKRYDRCKNGDKVGENKLSFEEFMKEEKAPTEVHIKEIGKNADIKIKNNSSLYNFRKNIEQTFIRKVFKKALLKK